MHLCYESYRFEPREALFSPGVAYPDAYADKPGHDGEKIPLSPPVKFSFPRSVNAVGLDPSMTGKMAVQA